MAEGRARVDVWVWSVRLTPSRSAAATACRGGHVRVNGERAKPATQVSVGDEVRVRLTRRGGESIERIVQVRQILLKRVSAALAAEAYVDHTPPPPPRPERPAPVAVREPGAGRPTKRERRAIDRLRAR
jgi:ribosome-associated heat shock protein Hsp15